MIAYRYHYQTNLYMGTQERQLDPIATEQEGKEVYLMPANCTTVEPPETKDGYNIKWNGESWDYEEQPKKEPEPPEEKEPTTKEKLASLDTQYTNDKATLQQYYMTYLITGDTEGMAEIKNELEALAEEYDKERAKIEGDE